MKKVFVAAAAALSVAAAATSTVVISAGPASASAAGGPVHGRQDGPERGRQFFLPGIRGLGEERETVRPDQLVR